MRAWASKDVVGNIEEFRPGMSERLRREVPFEAWETIQDLNRLEWISVREGRAVPAAVWHVLGEEDAREYFRWLLPRQANRPVLRGLLRASIKLFGLSPASFVRTARGAWGLAFQEVGEPFVEFPSMHQAVLQLRGVPLVAREDPIFLQSFAGSFAGFYDLCSVSGTVDLQVIDDTASFIFSW